MWWSIDPQFQQEPGEPREKREYLLGPARGVSLGVVGGVLGADCGATGPLGGGVIVGEGMALPVAGGVTTSEAGVSLPERPTDGFLPCLSVGSSLPLWLLVDMEFVRLRLAVVCKRSSPEPSLLDDCERCAS